MSLPDLISMSRTAPQVATTRRRRRATHVKDVKHSTDLKPKA